MEAEAIRDLQQDKGSGINQLSVAEARLLVRILIVSEKDLSANHPKAETAQRVETLLKSAGWSNFSEAHLRDIVRELDDDQCRQIVLGDGR
jgi:hypothetical protein